MTSTLAPDRPRAAAAPPPRRARLHPAEVVAYAGMLAALAAALWLNQRGLFTPDIKPEVYLDPARRLAADLATWLPDPYLGTGNYNLGLAPVDAVSLGVQRLGVGPEDTVRLLRFVLYGFGAWGAVRLYRRVAGGLDRPAGRLAVAAVWVCNPYALVGGATLAVAWPLALFPWQCLVLLRALGAGRGWRWPALFALAFFAMSGMNAGAVPVLQLVAVPVLAWWVHRVAGVPWRRCADVVARCALLCVAVSLYWLVPSAQSAGAGRTVVDNSETLEGIASVSSWAEVLRGLGLWPMYGGDASGPWQPGFAVFLHDPLVVVASFALLAGAAGAALLTRSRARLLGVGLLVVVGAVMVGLHPPQDPSPLGRALRWAFEEVPGLVALRTTNKAGAGLALGLALLAGLAVAAAVRRLPTHAGRAGAAVAAAAVLAGVAQPAWSGELFVGRWAIPDYWRQAAADLGAGTGRLWFVPGQVLARYRWSTSSVDDVNLGLLGQRASLVRTVLPTESAQASNFLAAVDTLLQERALGATTLSTYARYLGVDQVLLRNDVDWEDFAGARPAYVEPQLDADAGLRRAAAWGSSGQNTRSAAPAADLSDLYEAKARPLRVYEVRGARPVARAESVAGTVVVAGDGWALPGLSTMGLLAGDPSFRYAADTDPASFAELLGGDQRVVLTDTNRRRSSVPTRLTDAYGPLLPAWREPEATRALGGADDQTVAVWSGARDVTATSYGSDFGRGVAGSPDFAFDADVRTAWTFGAFGTARGQAVTLHLEEARPVRRVTVAALTGAVGARVDAVEVSAGGVRREATVDAAGNAAVDLGGVRADSVTVAVTRVAGSGDNMVGIVEVQVQGVAVVKSARLPLTVSRLAAQLPQGGRELLDRTAVDVVLQRAAYNRTGTPDEESYLSRVVQLPAARSYRVYGIARPDPRPGKGSYKPDAAGCYPVLAVDGAALRVRPVDARAPGKGGPWLFEACARVSLAAGDHRVDSTYPWTVDALVLRDGLGELVATPDPAPAVGVAESSATRTVLDVAASGAPFWLLPGTSADPRWRASVDGVSLGAPVVVDGYALGWRVPAGAARRVVVEYAPQDAAETARAAAAAALGVCLLLVAWPRRWLPARLRARPAGPWAPRRPRGAPSRRRRWAEAAALTAACWVLGGPVVAVAGGLLGLVHAWVAPAPRRYLWAAFAAFAAVPAAWMVGNAAAWGTVTPALVLDNPWPGWLAAAGLAALALGVLDDDRRGGPWEEGP